MSTLVLQSHRSPLPAPWLDADVLVIDPAGWTLPDSDFALGREVWIRRDGNRVRDFVKVHNAFLMFRADNPFLDFYRFAAERIVLAHRGARRRWHW
jgi:hypothetical protein